MTSFNSLVGNRIQERLDEIGWSQSRLAGELGVSRQIVNKIIHDRKNITLEEIKLIADILGISLEDLIQEKDENEVEEDPLIAFMGEVDSQEAKDGLNKAKKIMDLIIFHRDVNDSRKKLFD
ncbi:MAG: helix-turn-helix domain-containing protein [Halanaerobiales bacterium]